MIYTLILSCLKIFFCRILDVTLGSMRTVLVVREKTVFAACIGFFEVFIWYVIVRDALNFTGPVIPVAISYAAGYASGTYIGGTLAKKLIGGHVTVHVVTSGRDGSVSKRLRECGFELTVLDVNGSEFGEPRNLVLADFDKRLIEDFERIVTETDPNAFVIVQETKSYTGGFKYKRPGK